MMHRTAGEMKRKCLLTAHAQHTFSLNRVAFIWPKKKKKCRKKNISQFWKCIWMNIGDGYHDGNGADQNVIIFNEIEIKIEINRFATHTIRWRSYYTFRIRCLTLYWNLLTKKKPSETNRSVCSGSLSRKSTFYYIVYDAKLKIWGGSVSERLYKCTYYIVVYFFLFFFRTHIKHNNGKNSRNGISLLFHR